MSYRVEIEPSAWDALMELPKRDQERVTAEIEALEENPRPSGVVKLEGNDDLYRVRSGNYRIVYQVQDEVLRVLVVKIGNRRDVYKSKK